MYLTDLIGGVHEYVACFVRHNLSKERMFASLPFILLLLLQGFARQDCAELLYGSQDLSHLPVQARNLKSFDDLFATLTFSGKEQPRVAVSALDGDQNESPRFIAISPEGIGRLRDGYLEIRRSRDGPVG